MVSEVGQMHEVLLKLEFLLCPVMLVGKAKYPRVKGCLSLQEVNSTLSWALVVSNI